MWSFLSYEMIEFYTTINANDECHSKTRIPYIFYSNADEHIWIAKTFSTFFLIDGSEYVY